MGVPTKHELDRVRELVENSNLEGIRFFEVSARANDGYVPPSNGEEENFDVQFVLQDRADEQSFGLRLTGTVDARFGTIQVTVAADYSLEAGFSTDERTRLNFANEVGIMTLFPYFREAVSTASARVFPAPILVPVVKRGEISFSPDDKVSDD